jgi:hypothetical protein
LESFYRANYPDVFAARADAVTGAVNEVRKIYETYIFPEMKVDWQTHPDNVGHYYFQGCFRCHDGKHTSTAGKVIRNDCALCHTVLDQRWRDTTTVSTDGEYRHPIELGPFASRNCDECHRGNGGFVHPVDLGDIREFRCAECHTGTK